jgi:hypothetical protein
LPSPAASTPPYARAPRCSCSRPALPGRGSPAMAIAGLLWCHRATTRHWPDRRVLLDSCGAATRIDAPLANPICGIGLVASAVPTTAPHWRSLLACLLLLLDAGWTSSSATPADIALLYWVSVMVCGGMNGMVVMYWWERCCAGGYFILDAGWTVPRTQPRRCLPRYFLYGTVS